MKKNITVTISAPFNHRDFILRFVSQHIDNKFNHDYTPYGLTNKAYVGFERNLVSQFSFEECAGYARRISAAMNYELTTRGYPIASCSAAKRDMIVERITKPLQQRVAKATNDFFAPYEAQRIEAVRREEDERASRRKAIESNSIPAEQLAEILRSFGYSVTKPKHHRKEEE